MYMYHIGLMCEDDFGNKVVQVYKSDGSTVGQFSEGSTKIPEDCLIFYRESQFWLELARNAPSNDAKQNCIKRAEKANLLEIKRKQ